MAEEATAPWSGVRGFTSSSTSTAELSYLAGVHQRLSRTAGTELEQVLEAVICRVLEVTCSARPASVSKAFELLAYTMTRVQARRDVRLPLMPLAKLYCRPQLPRDTQDAVFDFLTVAYSRAEADQRKRMVNLVRAGMPEPPTRHEKRLQRMFSQKDVMIDGDGVSFAGARGSRRPGTTPAEGAAAAAEGAGGAAALTLPRLPRPPLASAPPLGHGRRVDFSGTLKALSAVPNLHQAVLAEHTVKPNCSPAALEAPIRHEVPFKCLADPNVHNRLTHLKHGTVSVRPDPFRQQYRGRTKFTARRRLWAHNECAYVTQPTPYDANSIFGYLYASGRRRYPGPPGPAPDHALADHPNGGGGGLGEEALAVANRMRMMGFGSSNLLTPVTQRLIPKMITYRRLQEETARRLAEKGLAARGAKEEAMRNAAAASGLGVDAADES